MHFSDQVNVSVWTLLTICFDRYQAIIHPFKSKQSKTGARWSEDVFPIKDDISRSSFQIRTAFLNYFLGRLIQNFELFQNFVVRYNMAIFLMVKHLLNILKHNQQLVNFRSFLGIVLIFRKIMNQFTLPALFQSVLTEICFSYCTLCCVL